MKFKKITALLLAGVMVMGLLAGCGNNAGSTTTDAGETSEASATSETSSSDEKITIRVLTRMAGASKQVEALTSVLDEFRALHPEVEVIDDSMGEEDAFNNILKTDMSAGTMANIFRLSGVASLGDFIDEGYLLDMAPYLEEDGEWNKFTEGSLKYYQLLGREGNWAIPMEAGLIGFYYNERLLKEAGYDKFPETWSEFTDAIAKLRANEITPIALGGKEKYMAGHIHNNVFYKYLGVDAAKQLGSRELAWDSEEVIQTLQYVKDLNDMGAFVDGAVGMD